MTKTSIAAGVKFTGRDPEDLGSVLGMLTEENPDGTTLIERYIACTGDEYKFKKAFGFTFKNKRLRCPKGGQVMFGGSGIVLPCVNDEKDLANFATIKYALKVPRPSEVKRADGIDDLAKNVKQGKDEYIHHAPLSHKNIARLIDDGRVSCSVRDGLKTDVVVLLVEWVEGASPLAKYLATSHLTWTSVIDLLIQVFDGLYHLHQSGLVHWDIKSDNFLVNNSGIPKLMDIGNARPMKTSGGDKAYSTKFNLPSVLWDKLDATGPTVFSSRKTPVSLGESTTYDSEWLDLWMLGRELNRLLLADEAVLLLDKHQGFPNQAKYEELGRCFRSSAFNSNDGEGAYVLTYLQLIVKRLLYPKNPSANRYYMTANEVIADLRKLQTEFGAAQNISELQAVPQQVMRTPVSGNIPFTSRVRAFQDSALVVRLSSHLQLGSAYRVYPGATHRRSEHLFGMMEAVTRYIRSLYADKTDPFWRISMEAVDIDALLVAALLHDIGHVAFGHELEEMAALLRGRTHLDYAVELTRNRQQPFGSRSETLSGDQRELNQILTGKWNIPQKRVEEFLTYVSKILAPGGTGSLTARENAQLERGSNEELKLCVLHSIIDSALDADKLDYLLRDAHHCGVQYPNGIDVDRFFQSLTTITHPLRSSDATRKEWPQACVGISNKGILPAESILVARYQMFSCVYWHHTHRALSAMLQMCVQELLADKGSRTEGYLDELLDVFRTQSDRNALEWLRLRVASKKFIKDSATREMLKNTCAGLAGDRTQLYRQFFELSYERPSYTQDKENPRRSLALSDKLGQIWDDINAEVPGEYINKVREFRLTFSKRLSAALRGRVDFRVGELLVDIPPSNRDQVNDVYVITTEQAEPIQELSPVADAISDAFKYWVRKVRVFIAPTVVSRMGAANVMPDEVRDACGKVLWLMASDEKGLGLFGLGGLAADSEA